MLIVPPSLQKPSVHFYSGDPAFAQLGEKASKKERDDYARKLERARETGNYKELAVGGQEPTGFKMRPVTGDQLRRLHRIEIEQGLPVALQLAFRCALVEIDNCGETKVSFVEHPVLGLIAGVEVCNDLDRISPRIVNELASMVLAESGGISPHR